MLELAQGFNMTPLVDATPFAETAGFFVATGGPLTDEDTRTILAGDVGPWLLDTMAVEPLDTNEVDLDATTVPVLLLEFLASQAVLAFRTKANSVMPKSAVGRVVMVDYEPFRRKDPPVPLLCLLKLDMHAVGAYNFAMHTFLQNGDARRLWTASAQVLRSGVDVFTKSEAFYFYTKVVSLATGAYTMRFDTSHVLR